MAEEGPKESKKPMTDEERRALCEKMDKELDDFINSLERKRYTDGWSEDKWEEEMDKHPFFMKSTPETGEMSPLAEGLAKLKYDPEENTALELATNYKEDGNFNYKHKNYRMAILGYTEGIRVKCEDAEMNATLYNNRAAAHHQLKNYRSALADSEKALKFKPDHPKARLRAAKCAFEIAKYEQCMEHCSMLLKMSPKNTEALDLFNKSKRQIVVQARNKRKQEKLESKKLENDEAVLQAIRERRIKIEKCSKPEDLEIEMLQPVMPGAQDHRVHFQDGKLHWPVLLFYPEVLLTDLLVDCPEDVPLATQLDKVFPAPWDTNNNYSIDSVNCYTEDSAGAPKLVNIKQNLGDILKTGYCEVKCGTPAFTILPRGSEAEKKFLGQYPSETT